MQALHFFSSPTLQHEAVSGILSWQSEQILTIEMLVDSVIHLRVELEHWSIPPA
jgi:hypothetical protein